MSEYFIPGNIEIKEISITNNKGVNFNLQGIFTEVNIYADLFTSTLSGTIYIEDGIDLFQNLPIIGEETVHIRFATEKSFDTIVVNFRVFQMTGFNHIKPALAAYQLELVSDEFLTNETAFVFRSLKKDTDVDINTILATELASTKKLDADKCTRERVYIPARQRPFEVISTLLNRSHLKTDANDYSLLLFEDVDGFKLKSVSKLINNATAVATYKYTPKNQITSQTPMESGFWSFNALITDNNVEPLSHLMSGALGGTTCAFDPITRTYGEKTYDYELTSNLNNSKLYTSENTLVKNSAASHQRFVVAGTKDKSYTKRNQFFMQHFNGIKYRMQVPGNSNLRLGQVINLDIPSRTGVDIENRQHDRYYSGPYMITSLKHRFTPAQTSYSTTIEIVRSGYKTNPEKLTNLVQRLDYDTRP